MTLIWAHRGASAHAPENTLPAFALAAEQGADGVELDVQLTKDGQVVVIHDETIDRTSTGSGKVVDLTLDELRAFDYSNGDQAFAGTTIPTLAEVFDLLGPLGLKINVELKNTIEPYPGLVDAVEQLTAEHQLTEQVLYSSFNHPCLAELATANSPVGRGVLHQDMLFEPWNYAKAIGATAIHPHWMHLQLIPDYAEHTRAAGLNLNVWTANEPEVITGLLHAGVDGIITDWPDRALELRG